MFFSTVLGLTMLAGVAVLQGCQQPPAIVEASALFDADGYPRSLVFDTPAQRRLADMAQVGAGEPPWYASRNDQSRTVVNGFESVTFERARVRTRDNFDFFNGRPNVDFQRDTRSERVSELVR